MWMDPRNLDDFRAAYTQAKRCFFVSNENRETVESNLAIELPRAEVIDNPFNVSLDASPSWPTTTPHWKLACVARIHYVTKSQDLILRVLRMPKWRTRPLHVTLYGSDNGNLNQLRRALDVYGLHRQIAYGGVSNNIEQLWANHHGLLLPSRAEGKCALVDRSHDVRMHADHDERRPGCGAYRRRPQRLHCPGRNCGTARSGTRARLGLPRRLVRHWPAPLMQFALGTVSARPRTSRIEFLRPRRKAANPSDADSLPNGLSFAHRADCTDDAEASLIAANCYS